MSSRHVTNIMDDDKIGKSDFSLLEIFSHEIKYWRYTHKNWYDYLLGLFFQVPIILWCYVVYIKRTEVSLGIRVMDYQVN